MKGSRRCWNLGIRWERWHEPRDCQESAKAGTDGRALRNGFGTGGSVVYAGTKIESGIWLAGQTPLSVFFLNGYPQWARRHAHQVPSFDGWQRCHQSAYACSVRRAAVMPHHRASVVQNCAASCPLEADNSMKFLTASALKGYFYKKDF